MESKRKQKSYNFEFKLTVINTAKEAGNRAAARKYNVDEKRVREWRKQEATLVECTTEARQTGKGKIRKRIPGAGRKRISNILDKAVFHWILDQRGQFLRVSRRSIQEKARELFVTVENNSNANFRASNG
ncbi:Brinker DNA-binding domain [Popillia japonica]|uniref:Brinker DNA-binding domain n=1 Tax=Popillia japonica TaxID=7064 RepID=A0AAW1LWF5_POPJA